MPADIAPIAQGVGVTVAAAIGVLLWWLKEWRESRRADVARRLRLAEVMVATRAEILVSIERTALQFDPAVSGAFRKLLMEALCSNPDADPEKSREMPQGVADEGNFVFEALKADLGIMPEDTIDPVVRHYRYDRMLSLLIRAFAAGTYEGVSDQRQEQAVTSLFWLGEDSLYAALEAVEAIDAYLANLKLDRISFTSRITQSERALRERLTTARGRRYSRSDSDQWNDGASQYGISYPANAYIVEKLKNGK